jgi:hypothetical protein
MRWSKHKRLRQQASRKQTRLDPRSLIAAEYVVPATSPQTKAQTGAMSITRT